jgi:rubredoxin
MAAKEVTCPNCGFTAVPMTSANPPARHGDPPSYDEICVICAFIFETHPGKPSNN